MPELDDEDITGQLDPWKRLDLVLLAQTRSLDALLSVLSGATGHTFESTDQRMISVIVLMIQGLGVSIHTVRQLTSARDMSIRDCYGIARSAAELAVNISYIAAEGETAAAQAEQHALQKSYRDLHRKGEVGGFAFDVRAEQIPDVEHFPGLADAIASFTRKGREVIDWTPLSISERIAAVAKTNQRAALHLAGSITQIYRHSSELLHGTYFGIVYFWTSPTMSPLTRAGFDRRWREHYISIFGGLNFAAAGVVELLAKRFSLANLLNDQSVFLAVTGEAMQRINLEFSDAQSGG